MFGQFFIDLVRRIRQKIWSPVFDVKIICPDVETCWIAGQRQDIFIIQISLPEDYLIDLEQEIEFPRPSHYLLKRNSSQATDERLFDCLHSQDNKQMEIIVYAHLTVSGKYLAYPQFPETAQVKFVERNFAEFVVQPSRPESLEVFEMNPLSGDRLNFYKGGKAEVFAKVRDSYGNTIKGVELCIESLHVTMEKCRFDSSRGCYVVIVGCNKEGKALLSLTCAGTLIRASKECTIIPAPLYPANCRSLRTNEGRVLAGEVVEWRLELYDICEHPFILNSDVPSSASIFMRIDDTFSIDDETFRQKEESLPKGTIMSDSHICLVEWKPLLSGHRSIYISINEIEIGKQLLTVKVEPGPLKDLIVEFENSSICYPTDEKVVTLNGLDVYGNSVYLNPQQWNLVTSGEGMQQRDEQSNDGKKMQYFYSFDRPGKYMLEIKSTDDALRNISTPEPFSMEVVSPLYTNKCVVKIDEELPIFRNGLRLKIFLCTCTTDVTPRCLEYVMEFLEIQVDHQPIFYPNYHYHGYNDSWEIEIFDLNYGEGKTFEVLYFGERLGIEILKVDLDGVRQFQITDYIEELELNSSTIIRCKGVPLGTLIGADHANINNINRVLAIDGTSSLLKGQIKKDEQRGGNVVDFYLDGFDDESVDEVYNLIGLLLEGFHHYRKQAHRFGNKRRKWKEKEEQERDENDGAITNESFRYRNIKNTYGELMNECHEKASNAIFEFYNSEREEGEIDLHGQQVANEETLENLSIHYRRLVREKNDEAIRHLRKRLNNFDHEKAKLEERDWLEIIVGAGHHSDNKRQKIRPKVEEFLKSMKYKFIECNPGSLLITFTEYSGEEPCVANFLCQKCRRSWESRTSWIGMFQKCYSCDRKGIVSKCYPFKLRSLSTSTSTSYQRKTDFKRNDHRRLCQKCIELGRDCSI